MARTIIYRTYRWIDKDPIIDAARTVAQDEGLKYSQIHAITGLAAATIDNWFNGDTRRPTNASMTAFASGLGYVRHDRLNRDGTVTVAFEKARALDWDKEIEKQATFILKHGTTKQKAALRKQQGKKKRARSTNGHAP